MSEERAEPVEARPWRPEDGPRPEVWTWPYRDRPALWVWSRGAWRWAEVVARQSWPTGRTAYEVAVDLGGDTAVSARTYWWPHPGLRVAHRSAVEPSRGPVAGGDLPSPPLWSRRSARGAGRVSSMAAGNVSSRLRRPGR